VEGRRRPVPRGGEGGEETCVYKASRWADSKRAAASHTVAMAGSYEMYKALFRPDGVVEVDDLVGLFDAARALAVYAPAKIEKVLVVSSSGGMGVQITDALNAAGLSVQELPKDVKVEFGGVSSPSPLWLTSWT
jgi:acyl-CoA synthetase (NDP forming)